MATSADTTTRATPTMNDKFGPFGAFPIVDRELVTDYGRAVSDPNRKFFRIHMDIPISDSAKFGSIRKALDDGEQGVVYADIKSTLPSEDPDNRRALAVVDAALKPDTSVTTRGSFPIIDFELVTDYGKPVGDLTRQFFRIHLDIPISDQQQFDTIQKDLDAGDEGAVYADVKAILPSVNPINKRAHAVVDAALRVKPV